MHAKGTKIKGKFEKDAPIGECTVSYLDGKTKHVDIKVDEKVDAINGYVKKVMVCRWVKKTEKE